MKAWKNSQTRPQNNPAVQKPFAHRVIAVAFVAQAVIIGLQANRDILSGKPILDTIARTLSQGIELIVKASVTPKKFANKSSKPKSKPK